MEKMRLQKYIAHCGVASRRKAEEIIANGRVTVNDEIVYEMGIKVDDNDLIKIDGKRLKLEKRKVYILFNKPAGVITSSSDEFGRKTVLDYLDGVKERVYPVGRLDYATSGLLILTNDGELTNYLTHPSHEISKTYIAEYFGKLNDSHIAQLEEGITIDDYITLPATVKKLENNRVMITIREGKNRQVRKMLEVLGCSVGTLTRISIGQLQDRKLERGKWRYLSRDELRSLGYGSK